MAQDSNKRAHFRIEYPQGDMPKIHLNTRVFLVVDLSESGVKVLWADNHPPIAGSKIAGKIVFPSGGEEVITGSIIRSVGGNVILALSPPIPLSRIMKEQRYLISKYKSLKT